LRNSVEQFRSTASPPLRIEGYTSMMLKYYLEALRGKGEELQVLDVGPVCGENISYFAQQVKKLHVCDLFIRMDRLLRSGRTNEELWKHLDYPDSNFHGIHIWDFIDHLADDDAGRLIKSCHRMLKPGGMTLAVSFGQAFETAPAICSFVAGEKHHVSLRPQPHLNLPWHHRNNRQLTSLLGRFSRVTSFLSRSGARELLLERD
jgi:hypothetical protein